MTTDIPVSGGSTVVAASQQVSCVLAGEAIVLDLGAGVYYSLNPVAARVWELVRQPRTVDEILATLLAEYDVDAARCERDVTQLLRDLAARQLLTISAP